MTDTRRYVLVWIAAVFIGVNAGIAVLMVATIVAESFPTLNGAPRQVALYLPAALAWLATTLAIGKALVRLVAKQLK